MEYTHKGNKLGREASSQGQDSASTTKEIHWTEIWVLF